MSIEMPWGRVGETLADWVITPSSAFWDFSQASMTKASLTAIQAMVSTPAALILSALTTKPGRWVRLQPGVKQMSEQLYCSLCGSECSSDRASLFFEDHRRRYVRCSRCALVFVPPEYCLSAEAERAEYDLHRNDVHDPGYRRFLSRLATPLMERLSAGAKGLDFGCGPGPALAAMLGEAGYQVSLYDVFYQPDPAALSGEYDFVCATEVVEHLHQPGRELQRLWQLLAPGGYLGIMTKLVRDRAAFANWHYKNDPTHVCFFSETTWHWWAQQQGASLTLIGSDVILLAKV